MRTPAQVSAPVFGDIDIFDAILRLRHAFLAAGMSPPEAIELASWEDGMRLMREVRGRYNDRFRRERYSAWTDDAALTEVDISGIKVRWPPKRWARPASQVIDL